MYTYIANALSEERKECIYDRSDRNKTRWMYTYMYRGSVSYGANAKVWEMREDVYQHLLYTYVGLGDEG